MLITGLVSLSCLCAANSAVPNIIIITADEVGFHDLNFHRTPSDSRTPYMDTYVPLSTVLRNYYVSPFGHATRSALMTGEHPAKLGTQFATSYADATVPYGLPPDWKILPQYLQELGFKTHAVGQWDLGFYHESLLPTKRGYDTFYGSYLSYGKYLYHTATDKKGHSGLDLHANETPDDGQNGMFKTELYSRKAVQIIEKHDKSNPLHLYVALQAAHIWGPDACSNELPRNYLQKFTKIADRDRACFLGYVSAIDGAFGAIMTALKKRLMLVDSIVVFTTTSTGAAAGEQMNFGSNYPLRGTRGTVWEGGVRGHAFIYTSRFRDNRISNCLFHATDWLPTLLHAYQDTKGETTSIYDASDAYGTDQFSCVFRGDPTDRTSIIHFAYGNSGAVMRDNYKLIVDEDNLVTDLGEWYSLDATSNICSNQINRNSCSPRERPCLYEINRDPCEQVDLAQSNSALTESLLAELRAFNSSVVYRPHVASDPRGDPANFNNIWHHWINANNAQALQQSYLIIIGTIYTVAAVL